MTRHYTRPKFEQPTPDPKWTNKPWWKSPVILGSFGLGFGVVSSTLFVEFTTKPVIHIRADDNSDSALGYILQRQMHCQVSTHHYKLGDTVKLSRF